MFIRTTFFVAALCAAIFSSVHGLKVCSVEAPKANQVCVTIKFPWAKEPAFFCTEKDNINYMPQCNQPGQSRFCHDDGRNDTLKIATPWDCCPIISTPNMCNAVVCPQAPFNRTCKAVKAPGSCCPTYFCDNGEPEHCNNLRLKPECLSPPANKENCIAFRDPYGCCTKYQCKGEEKPGTCPRLRHIPHHHDHHHHHTETASAHHHTHHHANGAAIIAQSREADPASQETLHQSSESDPQHRHHHHGHHHHHHHHGNEEGFGAGWKKAGQMVYDQARDTVQRLAKGFKNVLETQGGPIGRSVANMIPKWLLTPPSTPTESPDRAPESAPAAPVKAAPLHAPAAAKYHRARFAMDPAQVHMPVTHLSLPPIGQNEIIPCTGDYTCPGTMKCCGKESLFASKYGKYLAAYYKNPAHAKHPSPLVNMVHLYRGSHGGTVVDGVCVEAELEHPLVKRPVKKPARDAATKTTKSPSGKVDKAGVVIVEEEVIFAEVERKVNNGKKERVGAQQPDSVNGTKSRPEEDEKAEILVVKEEVVMAEAQKKDQVRAAPKQEDNGVVYIRT